MRDFVRRILAPLGLAAFLPTKKRRGVRRLRFRTGYLSEREQALQALHRKGRGKTPGYLRRLIRNHAGRYPFVEETRDFARLRAYRLRRAASA